MRPDRAGGYRLAIVNPLTLVGEELKSILRDRGLPYQKLALLSSMEDETGALTDIGDEAAFVNRISGDELEGLDLVFFCGDAEENLPWMELSSELNFITVDLSQPTLSEGIPVVAGVNSREIDSEPGVIVSPHPVATPLVMVLSAIAHRAKIELCAATVIQPASEFGQRGIDELLQQTIHVLNVQSYPKEVFAHQLAFNLYPAAQGTRDERYVAAQAKSILGGNLPLTLAIAQGTTFHSHTFSIFLKLSQQIDVASVLEDAGGIEVAAADDTFTTVDASGKDQILVGRVQEDPAMPGAYWIWLVSDNVRRATALNAVMVAEDVLARFRPIAQ